MTARLLDTLRVLGHPVRFVDKRFSRAVADIGVPSVRKVFALVGLLARTLRMVIGWRPHVTILFATTRPASFVVDWLVSEVLRLSRRSGGRIVLYLHSQGFRQLAERGRPWRFMVERLFGSADEVVCLGPALTADPAPFGRSPISCLPNTPAEEPMLDRSAEPSTVLFLSNLIQGKGAEAFARIAASVSARLPGLRALIAGHAGDPAVERAVRAELEERSATQAVSLVGPVAGEAKWRTLNGARCLAFTSELEEAQPLTIIEAMACGVPVVAFRRGGIADLVEHGVTGYLVPPGEELTFADHVLRIHTDDALHARLSAGAQERFAQVHSAQAFSAAWEETIGRVAS
jgi:glycosyltransferase involved in cell wall biosynthesis